MGIQILPRGVPGEPQCLDSDAERTAPQSQSEEVNRLSQRL